jgi:hypothetical protein
MWDDVAVVQNKMGDPSTKSKMHLSLKTRCEVGNPKWDFVRGHIDAQWDVSTQSEMSQSKTGRIASDSEKVMGIPKQWLIHSNNKWVTTHTLKQQVSDCPAKVLKQLPKQLDPTWLQATSPSNNYLNNRAMNHWPPKYHQHWWCKQATKTPWIDSPNRPMMNNQWPATNKWWNEQANIFYEHVESIKNDKMLWLLIIRMMDAADHDNTNDAADNDSNCCWFMMKCKTWVQREMILIMM